MGCYKIQKTEQEDGPETWGNARSRKDLSLNCTVMVNFLRQLDWSKRHLDS
jgi:hypothetical protein